MRPEVSFILINDIEGPSTPHTRPAFMLHVMGPAALHAHGPGCLHTVTPLDAGPWSVRDEDSAGPGCPSAPSYTRKLCEHRTGETARRDRGQRLLQTSELGHSVLLAVCFVCLFSLFPTKAKFYLEKERVRKREKEKRRQGEDKAEERERRKGGRKK